MSKELREFASVRVVKLADLLLPLLPDGKGVVSFVGAGGKTSLLVHLARELAEGGRPVLVTTTTKLADPRGEGNPFTRTVFCRADAPAGVQEAIQLPEPRDAMFDSRAKAGGGGAGSGRTRLLQSWGPALAGLPGITLLVAGLSDEPGKLEGIDPAQVAALRASRPLVLVEADGSRRLPIKAPEAWEPVIPEATDVTVGVVGLDALGRPMNGTTVHRPARFAAVAGCPPGTPIAWEHLVALARHPEGLFKKARGSRVVLLNKIDVASFVPSPGQAAALDADLVVLSGKGEAGRFFFTFPAESSR